jgi:O-acetyl-ADP-ribose deacetylase (regulator of RNase III)
MTTIRYLPGDVTRPRTDGRPAIVCQVCNDAGKYGAGVSGAIARRWPFVETKYREWHRAGGDEDDRFRLGAVQFVAIQRGFALLWVANMVAQHGIRQRSDTTSPAPIRYDALRECMKDIALVDSGWVGSVHMPRIGAGLAGGHWPTIEGIVREELVEKGVEVTVYERDGR